jgi:hypothetical protein
MTISHIPQELIEHFVSFLHADRDTLAACSLVRSSWTRAAQRELYRSLRIHTAWKTHKFADFAAFLSSFQPNAPQRQIQHLTLCGNKISANGIKHGPGSKRAIAGTIILEIVRYLPCLQTLSMMGFCLTGLEEYPLMMEVHNQLRQLQLAHIVLEIGSPAFIATFLNHCGSSSLILYDIIIDQDPANPPLISTSPAHITSLSLRSRWQVGHLLQTFSSSALKRLDIDCVCVADVEALARFLCTGVLLTHLGLDMSDVVLRAPRRMLNIY